MGSRLVSVRVMGLLALLARAEVLLLRLALREDVSSRLPLSDEGADRGRVVPSPPGGHKTGDMVACIQHSHTI